MQNSGIVSKENYFTLEKEECPVRFLTRTFTVRAYSLPPDEVCRNAQKFDINKSGRS